MIQTFNGHQSKHSSLTVTSKTFQREHACNKTTLNYMENWQMTYVYPSGSSELITHS